DLPGNAEAVAEPAALLDHTTRPQSLPIAIDLSLVHAVDDEGDGVVEWVERSGAHGHEGLPGERELDHLNGASRSTWTVRRQRRDTVHAGVREDRHIEVRRFDGFMVEPEVWDDLGAAADLLIRRHRPRLLFWGFGL